MVKRIKHVQNKAFHLLLNRVFWRVDSIKKILQHRIS